MPDDLNQFHVVPIPAVVEEDHRFRALIAAGYAAVDVQLSGDALANDEAFTQEYGHLVERGRYRHASLVDELGEEGMARVRRFVADLLFALTSENDRFVWFLTGRLRADLDDEHSDDRLLISGWVDEARINGSFVLFGGERDQVPFEARRLGDYDRVRGIAGPALSLADVLTKLTLASPVPTSAARIYAGRSHLAALEAVLPIAGLFFEEIDNGTRLRLVSGKISSARMEDAVASVRRSLEPS
jgi:hypothetical protein